jgi:hypothetical protein
MDEWPKKQDTYIWGEIDVSGVAVYTRSSLADARVLISDCDIARSVRGLVVARLLWQVQMVHTLGPLLLRHSIGLQRKRSKSY